MTNSAPKPSPLALVFQCGAVVAFGVCLYLFGHALQTSNNYDIAIKQLQERKFQLNRANRQVDNYMNFIHTNPLYQAGTKEPQWEKIAETWEDLPFPALLQRFSNLYRKERPFILDYFAATTKANERQTGPDESNTEIKGANLKFIVQGYYLCPCQ